MLVFPLGYDTNMGLCVWRYICTYTYVCAEAHEPPEGASNYVQWHLTLNSSDTFLIWTFPQVRNLPLWSLRVRVKHAQCTAC